MAFTLHQDPPPALRQETDRQVIGERARRHEYRRLFAKQLGHLAFEMFDGAAQREFIGIDAVVLGKLRKQPGIFARATARDRRSGNGLRDRLGSQQTLRERQAEVVSSYHVMRRSFTLASLRYGDRVRDPRLWLGRRISADKAGGNFDRIVIDSREELNGALDWRVQASTEFGDFRDAHRPSVEISGAFVEHALEHKGDYNAARRLRRLDTAAGINRQLEQRFEIAKTVALRLIKELTL